MASVGNAQAKAAASSDRALCVLRAKCAGNREAAGVEQDGWEGGVGLREEAVTLAAEEAVVMDETCQVWAMVCLCVRRDVQ